MKTWSMQNQNQKMRGKKKKKQLNIIFIISISINAKFDYQYYAFRSSICWGRILRKSYKSKSIYFLHIHTQTLVYFRSRKKICSLVLFKVNLKIQFIYCWTLSFSAIQHLRQPSFVFVFLIWEWDEKSESDTWLAKIRFETD